MAIEYGTPFTGRKLELLREFLHKSDLDYDTGVQFSVIVWEGDEIIATGSLDKNVLKCIAVSPMHQGEGLSATVISELRKEAFNRGHSHLFLFTTVPMCFGLCFLFDRLPLGWVRTFLRLVGENSLEIYLFNVSVFFHTELWRKVFSFGPSNRLYWLVIFGLNIACGVGLHKGIEKCRMKRKN